MLFTQLGETSAKKVVTIVISGEQPVMSASQDGAEIQKQFLIHQNRTILSAKIAQYISAKTVWRTTQNVSDAILLLESSIQTLLRKIWSSPVFHADKLSV